LIKKTTDTAPLFLEADSNMARTKSTSSSEIANDAAPAPPLLAKFPLSFVEFVALIALLMALTALSIDVMLPALPEIARSLGAAGENDRQLILSLYLLGFASGQFLFGPLSDRFGRKKPLLIGLALYALGTVLASASQSFHGLLAARVIQGMGAAAPRVIALAIVRDRFDGREMARVLSFAMMVFIVVPILGPSVGEGILQFSSWRSIFAVLLVAALVATLWASVRLPETRSPEDRLPLSSKALWDAVWLALNTRQTLGYVLAMGFVFGLLVSYIVTAEQIFVDVYGLGPRFPIVFGAIAVFMVAASVANARLVRRIGMRVVSHSAMLGALAACGMMALAGYPEKPPLILFCGFMAAVFFCFGLIMPNFNALAMEPMGRVAGTASSLAGFYSTGAAAAFGTLIGRSFDGSLRPLCIGITLLFLATFVAVLITERFRLLRPNPAHGAKIPHRKQ
jgi:MFS transporter, DHA1 family, multidrug resistance protein